jgi:hypothetical protein
VHRLVAKFLLRQQHVGQEGVGLEHGRRGEIAHAGFGDLAMARIARVGREQGEEAGRCDIVSRCLIGLGRCGASGEAEAKKPPVPASTKVRAMKSAVAMAAVSHRRSPVERCSASSAAAISTLSAR